MVTRSLPSSAGCRASAAVTRSGVASKTGSRSRSSRYERAYDDLGAIGTQRVFLKPPHAILSRREEGAGIDDGEEGAAGWPAREAADRREGMDAILREYGNGLGRRHVDRI